MMLGRFRLSSIFTFSQMAKNTAKNSINPVTEHVAYGHYFPKEWTD